MSPTYHRHRSGLDKIDDDLRTPLDAASRAVRSGGAEAHRSQFHTDVVIGPSRSDPGRRRETR